MSAPPLRVLQSFTPDRGDVSVNPYTSLLERSLRPRCEVHRFTWPRALAGRYDVLHCHWPEHLIGNRQWLRRTVAQVLFALLLVVVRVRRIAVVQTIHNVEPHAVPSRISAALLRRLDTIVGDRIYLHDTRDTDPRSRAHVFPHGDYDDWYAERPRVPAQPGRLVHFGRVHRYKNVDGLLRAVAESPDAALRLVVAGSVVDGELERELRALAAADPRVDLRLEPVPDDELSRIVTSAEAVVLPYEYLYNSGSLLLALTLGRPVVVPRSELGDGLADEVGHDWVATYDPPLDGQTLRAALNNLRAAAQKRGDRPDFVDRDWDAQAERLVSVYRDAVAARRG
ncbi:beta-1,4-mannosyltransferase&|uniref:Beta-1,4-mannosyltransferase n=1 Tax=Jatrophihabitans endophyticus TaxID=1206085 RepID=A0A1M5ILD9_9ACTN|nr:glycosyltransferase [Jatrophihabitans endophyticus]SHG28740.1 beta-1,4-mannosyltransferase&\